MLCTAWIVLKGIETRRTMKPFKLSFQIIFSRMLKAFDDLFKIGFRMQRRYIFSVCPKNYLWLPKTALIAIVGVFVSTVQRRLVAVSYKLFKRCVTSCLVKNPYSIIAEFCPVSNAMVMFGSSSNHKHVKLYSAPSGIDRGMSFKFKEEIIYRNIFYEALQTCNKSY